jgi:hypothetical protein
MGCGRKTPRTHVTPTRCREAQGVVLTQAGADAGEEVAKHFSQNAGRLATGTI